MSVQHLFCPLPDLSITTDKLQLKAAGTVMEGSGCSSTGQVYGFGVLRTSVKHHISLIQSSTLCSNFNHFLLQLKAPEIFPLNIN